MLCLVLSAAFSYAHGVARTEFEKGTPIIVIQKVAHGGPEKSGSILPTIDGHCLSVTFTENLGQVSIDISTVTGSSVDFISTQTPNGVMLYIPNTGNYVVTFTLPNGDEYYGEFEVTDN